MIGLDDVRAAKMFEVSAIRDYGQVLGTTNWSSMLMDKIPQQLVDCASQYVIYVYI